jgi:hypothetical protein
LAFVHIPKEKRKKLDYKATLGVFVGQSISTEQYFVYDPLVKMLHHCRDVVIREGKRYTALNAADMAIINEDFYREVIVEPAPTKKQSETSVNREAANWRWNFQTSNGGAIGRRFTSGSFEAEEEVMRISWP